LAAWKVTVRNGSTVQRQAFDDLEAALAEARRQTDAIVAEGPMAPAKAFREYEPSELVRARIEISGKGLLRPPTAGVDIQGDQSLVGFIGGVKRKPIEAKDEDGIFAAIREALA
jgi:hypothetical protein